MFQKGFVKSMLTLAVVALMITSCKDDKEEGPASYFTLENEKNPLKLGALYVDPSSSTNSQTGAAYYRHDIVLAGDGFEVDLSNGDAEIKGQGNAMALSIVSASQELEAGTFNFTGTEENPTPFDFWDGTVYMNYNTETEAHDAVYQFTAGKITVTKSGDIYTVDFEGTIHQALTQVHPEYGLMIGDNDPTKVPISISGHYKGLIPGYVQD
jgi:hypothetical protein